MPKTLQIDWLLIEQTCAAGLSLPEAAVKFNVKPDTLKKRAARHKWVLPSHVALAVRVKNELAVQKAATDWLEKGEKHRETAFEIASESVKKFKSKAPKNFRELEAADKIARRAAGLDTGETNVHTLINLNERMANHEDEQPIEADAVEVAEAVEVEAIVTPAKPAAALETSDTLPIPDAAPASTAV